MRLPDPVTNLGGEVVMMIVKVLAGWVAASVLLTVVWVVAREIARRK